MVYNDSDYQSLYHHCIMWYKGTVLCYILDMAGRRCLIRFECHMSSIFVRQRKQLSCFSDLLLFACVALLFVVPLSIA